MIEVKSPEVLIAALRETGIKKINLVPTKILSETSTEVALFVSQAEFRRLKDVLSAQPQEDDQVSFAESF